MSGVQLVTAASAATLAAGRGPHAARRQPRHSPAVHLLRVLLLLYGVHHLDLWVRQSAVLLLLHSCLLLLLHWIVRSVIRRNLGNIAWFNQICYFSMGSTSSLLITFVRV